MFIENKYYKWYKILTAQKDRNIEGYTENHHIVPRSFGGSNKKENLVILTAREHFIAHLLLTKCTEGINRKRMVNAYVLMAKCKDKNQERTYKVNANQYAVLKQESIKDKKLFRHSDETKKRISTKLSGIKKPKFTDAHLENMSKGKKGIQAWNKGITGHKDSELTKERKRIARNSSNWKMSDGNREAIKIASTGTVTCFDKHLLIGVKISTTDYNIDNNSRYVTFQSNEYKLKYKEAQSA